MTRLYLVRHGETLWNNTIRIQGHTDIPLNETGRQQARHLADRMRSMPIDAAYASDLSRAAETASILAAGRSLDMRHRAAVREASFGSWEGLNYEEIKERFPEENRLRREQPEQFSPPGGESIGDLRRRVAHELDQIVAAHAHQCVLVVTHGGPIRVVVGHLLGLAMDSYWKLRIDNCSLSILDTYPEGAILSLLNDTSHLP